ncbi:MAG: hypothetical protein EAZ92_02200, partial [Candidatus Kapaibacterium sp.]
MNLFIRFSQKHRAVQTARMLAAFLFAVASAMPVFAQVNAQVTPPITEMLKKHNLAAKQAFTPPQQLMFIENKGQWQGNDTLGTPRFLARTRGANVWVMDDGFVYDFAKRIDSAHHEGHVVKMRFADIADIADIAENSNEPRRATGIQKLPGYHNYFLGADSTKWATNVPLYAEVRMNALSEGISARTYFDEGSVRYDLIVAPGADPNRIALEFGGIEKEKVRIGKNGDLVLQTSVGEVMQGKLFAYQVVNGKKHQIPCAFAITTQNSPLKTHHFSFALGAYNPALPLVIDPLVWSTFVGGTGEDDFYHNLSFDASNNVYAAGRTQSTNFPTSGGAYQTTYPGGLYAGVVTKLNPTGTGLMFSTFLGGGAFSLNAMTIDASNNIYVTGGTDAGFPTTGGAYQTAYGGANSCYITKLNSTGTALSYSTYFGGAGGSVGYDISVDASGNAYISGHCGIGTGLPVTGGAYQTTANGNNEGFVTKLNATGSALVYSTFLGGTGNDYPLYSKIDASGNIYVLGYTSGGFPTTGGAYQTTYGGGMWDITLSKLNATGTTLLYSTYIGSTGDEIGRGLALDASNNVYVSGLSSGGFPTTLGPAYAGGTWDGILFSLNAAGSALNFSRYIGGSGQEDLQSVCRDGGTGDIYVVGFTTSTNYPTSLGAYQTSLAGGYDIVLTKLNSAASTILYSSYIGGANDDVGKFIVFNATNTVFLSGTASTGFPTTPGAYQTTYGGGTTDGFVTKFSTIPEPPTVTSFTATTGYPGLGIVINGTNFIGVTQVQFGGVNSPSFTVISPTQLVAAVPAGGASGSVSVTNLGGTGSLAGFTFTGTVPQVSTVVGNAAGAGFADGQNGAARLNQPTSGLKIGGDIYFTDDFNHRVRKYNIATGVVTTIAGSGVAGFADGTGAAAQFNTPSGLTRDGAGNIYVSDGGNHRIRKIVPGTGVVTTFAGSGVAGFNDATGTAAQFSSPAGLEWDGTNIFVCDVNNNRIRQIVIATAVVTTLAGSGTAGNADGIGAAAQFNRPYGITSDGTTYLYVAGYDGHNIRRVSFTGNVVTIAGSVAGTSGFADGVGTAARFNRPSGIAWVNGGVGGLLYIADLSNHAIRLMDIGMANTVNTYSGTNSAANIDGSLTAARYNNPTGIVYDASAVFYVFDQLNNSIRRVSPAPPTVSGFLPASAYPMQVVTITGTNLTGATQVQFGVTNAAWFTVDSPTQIRAVVPIGAVNGAISVIAPGGTATSGSSLTVTVAPQVSTLAGNGSALYLDAAGQGAQFNNPYGIAVNSTGDMFIAEGLAGGANNRIRKISPTGVVTTFAGAGAFGSANGTGVAAQFNAPRGVAVDASNNVYVADYSNHVIRAITPGGVVTTFAGSGVAGWNDATGTSAQFANPFGIAISGGFMYVAEAGGHRIRKISMPGGVVTTLAGSNVGASGFGNATGLAATFNFPVGVAVDGSGNVFVTDQNNNCIRKITPLGVVTTFAGTGAAGYVDGAGASAQFSAPRGMVIDATGNLYVSDAGNRRIRVVSPLGNVSTYAGSGALGALDGTPLAAQFSLLEGLTFNASGTLFLADAGNHNVRKITAAPPTISSFLPASAYPMQVVTVTGTNFAGTSQVQFGAVNAAWFTVDSPTQIRAVVPFTAVTSTISVIAPGGTATSGSSLTVTATPQVSTIAGDGIAGSVDAAGQAVRIDEPEGGVKVGGDIYFTESNGHRIRKLNIATGTVTTIAGDGTPGLLNGIGTATKFNTPIGIVSDGLGNLYVADASNFVIRRIVIATGIVTTYAGTGTGGSADGALLSAQFGRPFRMAFDGGGNLYITDIINHSIRKISGGTVSTLAGSGVAGNVNGIGTAAQFNEPTGIAWDGAGSLYITSNLGHQVRKIDIASATVTTLSGSGVAGFADGPAGTAQFNQPGGIAFDGAGNLYVADLTSNRIRVVSVATGAVSTFAGNGTAGFADGLPGAAQFSVPADVVMDGATIYVMDRINRRIRRIGSVPPTITMFTPTSAYPMQVVTITGTNLTGASQVQFGVTNAAWFIVDSPTQIRAVVPNGATNGFIGVTVPAGSALSASMFTVNPTPAISTFMGDGSTGNQDAAGQAIKTNAPIGAVFIGADLYIAEVLNHLIRKITPSGVSSVYAGSGASGFANGTGTAAQFADPHNLATDGTNIFVADYNNHRIRVIAPGGVVTTLAGSGVVGWNDATGALAQFQAPIGIAYHAGFVYVSEDGGHRVRKISYPGGVVTTLAGSTAGMTGYVDATGTVARFQCPRGLVVDAAGNVYVADNCNHCIRKITPAGVVTTLAGTNTSGYADATGTAARFFGPRGLTIDGSGNLYVTDAVNSRIRVVSPGGAVTTLAGSGTAGTADGTLATGQLSVGPEGLVFDVAGNLLIADRNVRLVRKIMLSGATYVWSGGAGADWQVAGNWSPPRTSPVPSDILQFNAGTHTPTNVPSQSIKQLIISAGADVTLTSAGAQTLSVGANGIQVAAGGTLSIAPANTLTLGIAAGATFTVNGTLSLSDSPVAGAGNLTFGANTILRTFNNDGVNGTSAGTGAIQVMGTITYNPTTSYVFTATNAANRLLGFAAVAGKPVITQCADLNIAASANTRVMDHNFTASGVITLNGRLQTNALTLSLNGTGTLTIPSGGRMIASANGTISNGNASPTSFTVQSGGVLEIQDNGQVSAASASDVNYIGGSTLEYSGTTTAKTTTAREIGASGVQNMIVSNTQSVTLSANATVQQSLNISNMSQLVLTNAGNPTLTLNGTLNQNGAANIASVNGANAGSITLAGTGALAL